MRSVSGMLNAVDGDVKADISLDNRNAKVDYDAAKRDLSQLKRVVEEAGYEVAG